MQTYSLAGVDENKRGRIGEGSTKIRGVRNKRGRKAKGAKIKGSKVIRLVGLSKDFSLNQHGLSHLNIWAYPLTLRFTLSTPLYCFQNSG